MLCPCRFASLVIAQHPCAAHAEAQAESETPPRERASISLSRIIVLAAANQN